MNNIKFLASLLHISDPTLPIGGYSHSNGLETFIQNKIVHNAATAQEFVENMLKYNLKYNDGAFVKLSYEAAASNDLKAILDLDQECNALKCPREIRQASQKLGVRRNSVSVATLWQTIDGPFERCVERLVRRWPI